MTNLSYAPRAIIFFLAALVVHTGSPVRAETTLHQLIDEAVGVGTPAWQRSAADECSDSTFVRRIHLDLTGRIPTADQTRQFLKSDSPKKRTELIDALLASPEHVRHMQYVLDAMLMERRPDKHVKADEWHAYLRDSISTNKPWDKLVHEMLTCDGSDPKNRPAAKFLLDRGLKLDEMTRDLGRIFVGRDMQCAQCHDHPHINDYLQRHYYGLSAFLNRSYLFTDPKSKLASIGEKAEGTVKFTSVFTNDSGETPPRMLDFSPIEDPPKAKEPYKVKPDKTHRSVPLYSRRLQLASAMTDPANEAFCKNIVNRLWALMIGQGMVEPVDMWHADNPPSNPQLLAVLVDAMREQNYDMRYMIREIAMSKTYQRSSEFKAGSETDGVERFAVATMKPLSPEQLAWSMMQATGLTSQTLEQLQAKQRDAEAKNKKKPEADKAAKTKEDSPGSSEADDPNWQEQALHEALKKHVDTFVGFFARPGVQTSAFDASANQALFLRNGAIVQSWLAPTGNRLTATLKELPPPELVDEFYLSVFSRPATAEETEQVLAYLQNTQDRDVAVRQLVWAGLSSAEFRFNH